MNFAGWVTIGKKGIEENKYGLTVYAYEGHQKKDRETGEWEKDGITSYRFNVGDYDKDLLELAGELAEGDRIFVVGYYRQRSKTEGKGKDAKVTYFDNWTLKGVWTKDNYNESLEDIHELIAKEREFRDE